MKTLALVMVWIFVLALPLGAADPTRGENEVIQCLKDKTKFLHEKSGFHVIRMNLNLLKKVGEKVVYKIPLESGQSYIVMACGSSTVEALEIKVFDPAGRLEQKSLKPTQKPLLEYQVKTQGDYFIQIVSVKGHGDVGLSLMMK